MSLYHVFINEKQLKTDEIYNRYKELILNSRHLWHITVSEMESKLYNEIVQLFYGATGKTEYYQYILIFADEYFKIENLIDTKHFEEEFEDAKTKIREKFEKEDSYEKNKEFFLQDDEVIIKKIAHYWAYKEAKQKLFETDLESIKTAFNKRKGIGKPFEIKDELMEKVVSKIKILNGYYMGEKIMQDDDFDHLLSNLKVFAGDGFDNGSLDNLNIKPIPQTKLTNDYVRAVLYEIYRIVLPKHQAPAKRRNFIQFIRASFAQLASESEKVTDKKFATKISDLNRITKRIAPEKPVS